MNHRISLVCPVNLGLSAKFLNCFNGQFDAFANVVSMIWVDGNGRSFDKPAKQILEFLSMCLGKREKTFPVQCVGIQDPPSNVVGNCAAIIYEELAAASASSPSRGLVTNSGVICNLSPPPKLRRNLNSQHASRFQIGSIYMPTAESITLEKLQSVACVTFKSRGCFVLFWRPRVAWTRGSAPDVLTGDSNQRF